MRDYHRLSWWRENFLPWAAEEYFSRFPRNRCDIVAEDWDTLLLLDACRYDLFAELNTVPGTLDSRLSAGSNTGEFFEANFEGTTCYDTVYVTANPVPWVEKWCSLDVEAVFHDVVRVWEDHWDSTVNTVRPGPVADAVRRAHEEYPNKRILAHFIQPHQPFLGQTGQGIEGSGMTAYSELAAETDTAEKKIWTQLEDGELSTDRAWAAYRENLELVLPYVAELCEELQGKTVVSADHGNLFGEFAWPFPFREYGHPRGIHTRKLIEVPWLEAPSSTRREITAEAPVTDQTEASEEERLDRLRHLGYR